MSEFEKSLNKFLEKETYIVAYRSNYDSAREFNNDLINYIKELQQEITKLKGVIETYEILIKANNINNWNELKTWLEEVIKDIDEARNSYEKYSLFEERLRSKYFAYNNTLMKMQGLENK